MNERMTFSNPWELVWGQPHIDASRLAKAIEIELRSTASPDFRARLLVRDSITALQEFWGQKRFKRWLANCPERSKIKAILKQDLGEPGFHNIKERLVTSINQAQLEQIFDLLSKKVRKNVEVNLAGSVATLTKDLTARPTDDIDFVDEVPAEIREQTDILEQINAKYGLVFGHVQSRYLPPNWQTRREHFGDFARIRVYIVNEYDIFVSKLASKLEKHRDDLRVLSQRLDKDKIKQLLITDGKCFLDNQFDRPIIESNWQFIYREPLFPKG